MRDKIIEIAKAEVGYKESPARSNKTKYGQWWGKDGEKWCALFVSWVYFIAGYKWPKPLDSPKGFIWVPVLPIRTRQFPLLYKRTFDPQPADIVVYDWNKDGTPDHVALFLEWIVKDKTFKAIEGNTSKGNDSNGGQVQQRDDRKITDVMMFVSVLPS